MTTPTHDVFAEMVAAYALGALDRDDRQTFERHLATCVACQRELAEMRRVTAGIGVATDPVAPPEALKARALANATSRPQGHVSTATPASRPRTAPRITLGWLAAAASLAAAVGAGIYAWSLRSQIDHLQETMTTLSERANTLRNNLDEARREAARLSRTIDIVQGPGTIQVELRGTKDAPAALGRAYVNATRGMTVSTEKLPTLRPGRAYQLWMVVPGKAPISAGVFSVASGAGVFLATVPDLSASPGASIIVAVTEEPAGGSPGPTTPILLAGEMKTR